MANPAAFAQNASPLQDGPATIQGKVFNAAGKPVSNALVLLEQNGQTVSTTSSNASGEFKFPDLKAGSYSIHAESSGLRSRPGAATLSSGGESREVDLVLEDAKNQMQSNKQTMSSDQPMEFADKPDFTVAGVTDWTAAGGHGSDSSLRTSESLVRETVSLKPGKPADENSKDKAPQNQPGLSEEKLRQAANLDPKSYPANRQLGSFYLHAGSYAQAVPFLQAAFTLDPGDQENEYDLALASENSGNLSQALEHAKNLLAKGQDAEWHSLAGDIDEKLGDPLNAVHEYEQAASLSPSETNYFNWGTELLLHRAVWQAQEVFEKGVKAYPQSSRMLTALGAALFAGARYDEAARRLCDASDLNPRDVKPYEFMAKIDIAAPSPLPCIEEKLSRFAHQQPRDSQANYFYAMALWKARGNSTDEVTMHQVETLLTNAVTIDPRCADGFFQLGNLSSSRLDYSSAIGFYKRAIEVNPQLAEAHYRLGVAYDRAGERALAQQEFQLHDKIKTSQADEVERARREVKQFLVITPAGQSHPSAP
ncbi:MAG: tetratricopeptide repeat protein [Terracidiphilus sp.]